MIFDHMIINLTWKNTAYDRGIQRENHNIYLCDRCLFNKLATKRPSEISRLKLLKRNRLPYIQTHLALQYIESISEHMRLCNAVEQTELRTQKFHRLTTENF